MNGSRWGFPILVLLCALSSGCASDPPSSPDQPWEVLDEPAPVVELDLARATTTAVGSALMDRLSDELDRGTPPGALRICSEVAPAITAANSTDRLRIRRISLKARNPVDRPDEYEAAVLQELEARHRAGREPGEFVEVVRAASGKQLRYLKPILVQEPCLACHGPREELSAEVQATLAEHYPDDKAVGYRAGQFRGAFSVVVDLD